ncbi:Hypp914 [Branchiostoma lanceolatum]|uniref:Hypp914 protein n=1 Tax=Branchiostoma lanceolatum TaxID=7740 RepID=A0A8K0EIB9_BRALA|nr:Hypp914 [Branchiostoma lanceolatum]
MGQPWPTLGTDTRATAGQSWAIPRDKHTGHCRPTVANLRNKHTGHYGPTVANLRNKHTGHCRPILGHP